MIGTSIMFGSVVQLIKHRGSVRITGGRNVTSRREHVSRQGRSLEHGQVLWSRRPNARAAAFGSGTGQYYGGGAQLISGLWLVSLGYTRQFGWASNEHNAGLQ